jgi:hypothetical protein
MTPACSRIAAVIDSRQWLPAFTHRRPAARRGALTAVGGVIVHVFRGDEHSRRALVARFAVNGIPPGSSSDGSVPAAFLRCLIQAM